MGEYYNIITQYKPGITGLWQISGRSEVTFEDRLDLDVEYHKGHTIIRDFKILFNTIGHVLNRKGAI